MDDAPVLICYDDSKAARQAIHAVAILLPDRRVVVLVRTEMKCFIETAAVATS